MKKILLLLLSSVFLFNILFFLQKKFLEDEVLGLVSQFVNPASTFLLILILGLIVVFEGVMFSLIMVMVGSVYGLYPGLLIGGASIVFGMSVSFLSVRHFGHGKFLVWEKKNADLKKMQKIMKKDFLEGLWLVHAIPILPNPLFIVASALSEIKILNFIILSLIGSFPYMLLAVSLGSEAVQGSIIAILVYGFLISGVLSIVLFRKEIRHHFVHA